MDNKKLMFFLFFLVVFITDIFCHITVEDIYNHDYKIINRTVIQTSDKPLYKITQNQEFKQIIVEIENAVKIPEMAQHQIFVSPVLERIELDDSSRGKIKIIITTKHDIYLEDFYLGGARPRIVLDIYNMKKPQSFHDKIAFAEFFTHVGFFQRALPLIQEIRETDPGYSGINYYYGRILLHNNKPQKAIRKFQQVRFDQHEYLLSQIHLLKLDAISFEYSDELEVMFSHYRDYFLRAKDIEKQQFLIAWISLLFGNYQEVRSHFMSVDDKDPEISEMLLNFSETVTALRSDNELQELKPNISEHLSIISGIQDKDRLLTVSIILIALLIVSIIIILVLIRKKACTHQEGKTNKNYNDQPEGSKDKSNNIKRKAHNREHSKKSEDFDTQQASIDNPELKKKLIKQLFQKGWDKEAIARELKTDTDEIEKFI